jgi:SAM-dependent methyltransferase
MTTDERSSAALDLHEVPCDYCGTAEADVVMTGRDRICGLPGTFTVAACRRCGLMRTNPQPTVESLGSAYGDGYLPHHAEVGMPKPPRGFLRWALVNYRGYPLGEAGCPVLGCVAWPLAALRLRNRKHVGYLAYEGAGRLLDFGCGIGRYVAQMAAAGWKAEGIDLAAEAVAAGRKAGLTIHRGTLPGAALPPESYDLVTLWHALEHVPSPMATLEAVRSLLRPGGRVAVVCPLCDSLAARWFGPAWYGLDLPRHLTHFTRATLRRHVEAAGLAVEHVQCIRRPTFVSRSYAYLAEDTGRGLHRWLGRSHGAARLFSHVALALRRTDEVLFVARRR